MHALVLLLTLAVALLAAGPAAAVRSHTPLLEVYRDCTLGETTGGRAQYNGYLPVAEDGACQLASPAASIKINCGGGSFEQWGHDAVTSVSPTCSGAAGFSVTNFGTCQQISGMNQRFACVDRDVVYALRGYFTSDCTGASYLLSGFTSSCQYNTATTSRKVFANATHGFISRFTTASNCTADSVVESAVELEKCTTSNGQSYKYTSSSAWNVAMSAGCMAMAWLAVGVTMAL